MARASGLHSQHDHDQLQHTAVSSAQPVRSGVPLGEWTPHQAGCAGRVDSAPITTSACSLHSLGPLISAATAGTVTPPAHTAWNTCLAKVTDYRHSDSVPHTTCGILSNHPTLGVVHLTSRQAQGRVASTPGPPLNPP